jgi:hypothetical protein
MERKTGHKISALALSLTLIYADLIFCLLSPTGQSGSKTFPALGGGFITRAYSLNVVNGYPDGRFYPDKSVTRAEFVS